MVRCFRCDHENPIAQKFCGECGAPLPGVVSLGASADAAASYTPHHLSSGVLSHRFALEGERKLVTVMFCDIADSTSLAARLGPEAMHELLDRFFESALAEVHRYEGTINQFLGDGFMALFGAPIAHEDHARRALLAATAMQQKMHNPSGDAIAADAIRLRIGLNTGSVVVGKIGDNLRMDYTAVGDTTHLAARLQSHADPGTVRVGDSTRRAAVNHCAFRYLGQHALKGIAEPVPVYEPISLGSSGDTAALSQSAVVGSPLIGREPELAGLSRALDDLSNGRGGVWVIRGEAGAGKSRLLAETKRHAAAQRVLWLEGRSVSYGRGLSYWPFVEILRNAFGIDDGDSETDALRKLEAGAGALFGAQAPEIVPYLATVMTLSLTSNHDQRVKFLDAQAMKRQIFLSMRLLFERLAQRQPLLLVLEDWHWADRSSVALCEHLLPLAGDRALSYWFTTRPSSEQGADIEASVAGMPGVHLEKLALAPLSDEKSRALIDSLVGATDLPENVCDQIQRRTEGNPFFIEEVIRALIADETLVRDGREGRWRLARPVADLTIPSTIQGVIVARIDRLEDSVKNVLKLASVIGRSFFLRVLKAISEATDEVEPGLDRLEKREFIRLRQQAPEIEYVFKHALVQEATYDSMLAQQRRRIHRSVAGAIERLFADRADEVVSLLAYHYAQAEDWPKAQAFLLAAGDQAGHMAADAEALEHYRQAEATFMKVAARELTPLQRATMDRKLGQAFYGVGNHDEAVAHLTRGLSHLNITYPTTRVGVRLQIGKYIAAHFLRRALPRFMGPAMDADAVQELSIICESLAWLDYFADEDRFALDGLIGLNVGERSGDLSSQSRGLALLGMVLTSLGSRVLAKRSIAESAAIAARANAPTATATMLFARGWLGWIVGAFDDSMVALEQSASAHRAIGDLRSWGGVTATLVWVLARRSEFGRAESLAAEVVRIGEDANDPHLTSWGLVCLGNLGLTVGPLDEAARRIEKARSLSARTSALRMHANAGGVLAKCWLRQGRIEQARDILREAIDVLEARGMRDMYFIEPITALAELSMLEAAQASSGAVRESALRAARSACTKALRCSRRSAAAWEPEALRLLGTLAWLRGAKSSALRRWRKSIESADTLKLPLDRARGLLEMGDRTHCESFVEEARRVFETTGAKVDMAFSLHVLARLAARENADAETALRRYDLAVEALDAVKAEDRFAIACRERSDLLARTPPRRIGS